MSSPGLISTMQSDALVREIERQLRDESAAALTAADREARAVIAQARAAARRRLHESIEELRREGGRRLARAQAQVETQARAEAQRQAAQAVSEALPLLRDALAARWRDAQERRQWTANVAALCTARLRNSSWRVRHPADWSQREQREFASALKVGVDVDVRFVADDTIAAGLRIEVDQAVLDATPDGLLADPQGVAALLLEAIERADEGRR